MPDPPRRLIVATTNAGKTLEVQLVLKDLADWTVEALRPGLPSIEETGTTFLENALLKATHYSHLVEGLTLADDSGLCVNALGGAPGVHTARYGATPAEQNRRVLAELAELGNPAERTAAFHCALVLARAGQPVWSTEAQMPGQITLEPDGDFGFGFDPIFFVPELRKTLARLTAEEKNRISARGRALVQLKLFLKSLLNV